MKRTSIILLLIFLYLFSTGQIPFRVKQQKIDSLFVRLKNSHDTAYVNVLNNLSLNLADRNFDTAYRFAQQALTWAQYYQYKKGEGLAYYNTGNCYFVKMDLKAALEQYFKAQSILEPLGPSTDLENLYNQMAYINYLVPHNERTIYFFQQVLKTGIAIGDSSGMGAWGACFEISYYYILNSWGTDPPESDRLLDSAYKYSQRAFDFVAMDTTRNLNVLINCLILKGALLKGQNKKEAYIPLSQALHFALKMHKTRACSPDWESGNDTASYDLYMGFAYTNLAEYFAGVEADLKNSEECFINALYYLRKTAHIQTISASLNGLGYIAAEHKQYAKALAYFRESEAYGDTFINNDHRRLHLPSSSRLRFLLQTKENQVSNYQSQADLYTKTGDLRKALEYQKKAETTSRNIMRTEFNEQIELMQANFEHEKSNEQISRLSAEKELQQMKLARSRLLLAGFGIFAVVLILVILLYYQRNRLKNSQKTLILEQKLLRAQMNPHFLFNSLTSIQNFIVCEKPDAASIYLSKFSKLVRNILDNSIEEYVPLEKEISAIENYIELQKVRWVGKFDYCIKIAPEIDDENTMIPPMLAQPFIENAIEHGVKHRETPGFIDIRFTLNDHSIIFEVEDNGVGREKAREYEMQANEGHRSMATSITQERLIAINKKWKKKITLDITDLKDESGKAAGTRVTFVIPIRRSKSSI